MNCTLFLHEVYQRGPFLSLRSNRPMVALLPSSYFVVQYGGRNAKVNFHGPNESPDGLFDGRENKIQRYTRALNMPKETK